MIEIPSLKTEIYLVSVLSFCSAIVVLSQIGSIAGYRILEQWVFMMASFFQIHVANPSSPIGQKLWKISVLWLVGQLTLYLVRTTMFRGQDSSQS